MRSSCFYGLRRGGDIVALPTGCVTLLSCKQTLLATIVEHVQGSRGDHLPTPRSSDAALQPEVDAEPDEPLYSSPSSRHGQGLASRAKNPTKSPTRFASGGVSRRSTGVSAYTASSHEDVTDIHTHAWTMKSMRNVGLLVAASRKGRDVKLLNKFPVHMRPVVACQFLATYVSEMMDKGTNAFPLSGGLFGELMKSLYAETMKVRTFAVSRSGLCVTLCLNTTALEVPVPACVVDHAREIESFRNHLGGGGGPGTLASSADPSRDCR